MPRILYLTPYDPDQSSSAAELRSMQIARALREVGTVTTVVVGTDEASELKDLSERSQVDVAYRVPVRRFPNTSLLQKVDWILNPRSPLPHGVGVDGDDLQRGLLADKFDLTWFYKLRTANTFSQWAWPRSVVDVDDVPSTFERSVLKSCKDPRDRLLAALRLWSWKRRERLMDERFSALTVCSDVDKGYLESLGVTAPIRVVPNGYERPAVEPVRRLADPPRIGFIGIFDYEPNVTGIQWFVRECWPRIKHDIPNARLRLVGRFSDGPLAPKGVDIDSLGWLADPNDEIASWASTVVPVHVGAGTRGKIAHAFSQKCPVISTALGAYGYDAKDGHNMLLAETADSFAAACVRTIQQPASAAAMADRAWHQFLDRWTWDAIRPSVWAAAEDGLRSK